MAPLQVNIISCRYARVRAHCFESFFYYQHWANYYPMTIWQTTALWKGITKTTVSYKKLSQSSVLLGVGVLECISVDALK